MYSTMTANFAGCVRREVLNGREHVVAPLSLIVPGVLSGSKGPLLYPPEEVAQNPSKWNGVPILVNHPTAGGRPLSARSPGVLDHSGIGVLQRAKYDGKLTAEGWFDVERTRAVDARILHALEACRPIELSTGLFTDDTPTPGVYYGREYEAVARNYRPDHLAILPDTVGACSLADGCGVLNSVGFSPEAKEWIMNQLTNTCNCSSCRDDDDMLPPPMSLNELLAEEARQKATQNAAPADRPYATEDDDILLPPTMFA